MKKRLISVIASAVLICACLTACTESGTFASQSTQKKATTTTTTSSATTSQTTASFVQAPVDPAAVPMSGECGEGIKWEIAKDGTLTVSGTGEIPEMSGGYDNWKVSRDLITKIIISDGITKIGKSAFSRCDKATEVSIPNSVREIGETAFYNCESLKEVIVPDSVEKLGTGVFWRCFGLEKAVVGKGIKELPFNTFCRCKSLKDVTLYEGLERLGDTCFEYCESITELVIPASVREFGYNIFPDDRSGLTIRSKAGSAVQEYAKKENIGFSAV